MNIVNHVSRTVHRGLQLTPASELVGAHTSGWLRPRGLDGVTSTQRGSGGEPHRGLHGPAWWRGEADSGRERTVAVKLGGEISQQRMEQFELRNETGECCGCSRGALYRSGRWSEGSGEEERWPAVGFQYRPFWNRKGKGGDTLRRRLMRGIDKAQALLRFLYHRAWDGVPWWCTVRRCQPGRWRLGRWLRKVRPRVGRLREFPRKRPRLSRWIGPNWQWVVVNSFHNFQTKIWVLRSRILNFKPKLNWGQIRINWNKVFEYFSTLQLLKISFEYSNLNQDFKWKASKLIKKGFWSEI
jgi:hypothetical protein